MSNQAKEQSNKNGLKFLLNAFTHEQRMLESKISTAHETITHDGTMGEVIEKQWIRASFTIFA